MKNKLKILYYLLKFKGSIKKAKKMVELLDNKEIIESSLESAKKIAKESDSIAATKAWASLKAELKDIKKKISDL
jgi:hypothetical protein